VCLQNSLGSFKQAKCNLEETKKALQDLSHYKSNSKDNYFEVTLAYNKKNRTEKYL